MTIADPPVVEDAIPQNPARRDLREATERWLDLNPHVYDLFTRFAREMVDARRHFGIGLLAERVRWECAVRSIGDDFQVNNNFRAYIARRLVEDMPEVATLLRFRKTRY